jgi:hypothetical protein
MKYLCIALLGLLSFPVGAAESVVVGRATKHFPIAAEVPCPPPDGEGRVSICMDAWIGFELQIKRSIAGPEVKGRVRAARIQHSQYSRSGLNSLTLFVLAPIEDKETRRILGADYFLREASSSHSMYCFRESPEAYGLDDQVSRIAEVQGSSYCFEFSKDSRK